MRGRLLGVDPDSRRGQIAGEDGLRYEFTDGNWADPVDPAVGALVDFEPEGRLATRIFRLPDAVPAVAPAAAPRNDRNRIVAALLALFIGTLGLHRFYLGRTGSAVVMLILSITVVGLFATVPWSLVDAVRYLMMSDAEFDARYARR